jgi:hypothetical protein
MSDTRQMHIDREWPVRGDDGRWDGQFCVSSSHTSVSRWVVLGGAWLPVMIFLVYV